MPTSVPDLILCDAQTATGAGAGVVGFGEEIRYAKGSGTNQHKLTRKFKARVALTDTTTGATATVTIEHCDDNSTYVTLGTMTLTLVTGQQRASTGKLFKTSKRYVRANVTVLTGGSAPTIDGYLTLGTFGA